MSWRRGVSRGQGGNGHEVEPLRASSRQVKRRRCCHQSHHGACIGCAHLPSCASLSLACSTRLASDAGHRITVVSSDKVPMRIRCQSVLGIRWCCGAGHPAPLLPLRAQPRSTSSNLSTSSTRWGAGGTGDIWVDCKRVRYCGAPLCKQGMMQLVGPRCTM